MDMNGLPAAGPAVHHRKGPTIIIPRPEEDKFTDFRSPLARNRGLFWRVLIGAAATIVALQFVMVLGAGGRPGDTMFDELDELVGGPVGPVIAVPPNYHRAFAHQRCRPVACRFVPSPSRDSEADVILISSVAVWA